MIFGLFQAWRVQGPLRGRCDLSNRNGSMCGVCLAVRRETCWSLPGALCNCQGLVVPYFLALQSGLESQKLMGWKYDISGSL